MSTPFLWIALQMAAVTPEKIQELKDIANKLRVHSVVQTTAAGSG